ncbi:HD-GYP domain-containing protein [Falsibacillus pallidus]|uniref:Putative nucleotidyltransferase with HDIG domain n=1 Tax=Falsibacillus pallidus TaxID=493781 RepID=A0A370GHT0_9BACI|nr:HD domain-containing phosphohydrolase [Falsibacillus pallidus]RDI43207.1 putative nucleotidyltransferase with HDIG domain [Falsibacillus pallidus]
MKIYGQFKRKMIFNYFIGSFSAVIGVGSIFIFQTLDLTPHEVELIWTILVSSIIVMFICEILVYRLHLRPLTLYYQQNERSRMMLKEAYETILHFPYLTVKRILLPHFLGLAIPSVSMSLFFIKMKWLSIPYSFIALAALGAFIIACLHAMIEYFLTEKTTKPIILDLQHKLGPQFMSINREKNIFSIKRKLLAGAVFISVFPILLFSVATQVRFIETSLEFAKGFLSWAALIITVITIFSITAAILLYKSIQKPLAELQDGFQNVQKGFFLDLDNPHTDEFSDIVNGFNHMLHSIKIRDKRNEELLDSFYTVIAEALDARDPYTAGHSIRVAEYSCKIGKAAGLSELELQLLRKSALLHDIGKIGVRDAVLLKENRLTDEEFNQIKQHPTIGARIVDQPELSLEMKHLLPGIKHHHERYDGKGYPSGLSGQDIPLFGRIIAIADAFDAMTSDRPYRKGMPFEKAISILSEGSGTQWDPALIEIFLSLIKETDIQYTSTLKYSYSFS